MPDAGDLFRIAVEYGLEDAGLRRFRYHLLRLTAVGLAQDEVDPLLELGRLALSDADVAGQVKALRAGSLTPLAAAIVDIADTSVLVSLHARILGAVLGAYAATAVAGEPGDHTPVAVAGAIAGAVAAGAGAAAEEGLSRVGVAEYCLAD